MVIRPCSSTTFASISVSALIGFFTAPPKCPLCKSRLGPVTSICQYANPRSPVVMDGVSLPIIEVSLTRMMSHASNSRCSSRNASRLGLPISSSPSKMNFTRQFISPSRTRYSNAFTWIMACPLSSSAPRA